MGKEAEFFSGLHMKKKPMKRRKHQLLNKVFDYLKSDTYMFAPLCSSSFSVVVPTDKLLDGNYRKKLVTKLGDYLKADTYMYAPLVISQPWDSDSLHSSKGPAPAIQEEMEKKRSFDVLKGGGNGKADETAGRNTVNVVSKDHNMDGFPHTRRSPMVTHTTRLRRETVKHMVYQNC